MMEFLRSRQSVGVVESVFSRAVNLRWDNRTISILERSLGLFPNSLVAPLKKVLPLLDARRQVVCRHGAVVVLGAPVVSFDLRQAALWNPRLGVCNLDGGLSALRNRLAIAVEAAGSEVAGDGFGRIIQSMGTPAVNSGGGSMPQWSLSGFKNALALLEACRDENPRKMRRAAAELIGLGVGLTPSGDDLIVGMLAGLAGVGHPSALKLARTITGLEPHRTTQVAQALLSHAARLEFSARLHRLVIALARADSRWLRKEVSDALAWGASSGADSLLGVMLGMSAALPFEAACSLPWASSV